MTRSRHHRNHRIAAFVYSTMRLNLLDHHSFFVASSSLTSCGPMTIERKFTGDVTRPSFSAPREVVARGWRLYVKLAATSVLRAVSLNRICQWGTIWWREKGRRGRELVCPEQRERKRKREREKETEKPSHRTRASAASLKLCRLSRTVGL